MKYAEIKEKIKQTYFCPRCFSKYSTEVLALRCKCQRKDMPPRELVIDLRNNKVLVRAEPLGICIANCGYSNISQRKKIANAHAIVTAVNNTYGKGINPEAVPELVELLKDARTVVRLILRGHSSIDCEAHIKRVEQALAKAEGIND